ncbi:MAG TPA: Crp/Fnr family transcriptional regulator [Flavobacterium sp.]|jgi:CRP/FNR family transcriptional regulator|uniref:Crp/Fnr family transcriptional regulator n=1 Tax=Flavobacterium sp. TaxID=239 RepID=UPI001B72AA91|nr:Crp/Fnr family transcriptional regulator [Flavobacterium sp.]MBP7183584.1 Crp/Fnr family transcriptional regulator [Flavobacterium sp.]MBP7317110.1 Crp/Fnr family transcriptional regulator [Flavobacterium sp.]HRM46864.1 Crp/Fnr family transcriptional regulator [Flavobacterium sp.]
MSFVLSKYSFKSNALLDKIKSEFMQELDKIRSTKMYPKGEILYEEGSNPKAVYRLKSGKVKIEQLSLDGKIRIVYVYTQGEFFGFRPLLSNEKHPVSAIFLEDSEVEIYEGKEFIEISKKAPNLSFNLVEILSFEFNVWINLISSLSHKSAKEKIALILLILNEKYRNVNGKSEITMTKSDIAKYSETSEETVVRVIGFFEEQEILKNQGRTLEIMNPKLLEIIAEGF